MLKQNENTTSFGIFKKTGHLLAILLVVLLAGCQSELYSGLKEREVNEMISVLASAGISASRTSDGKGGFGLTVARSDFSSAISTLSSRGLPRQNYGSLGNVFASDKLVSTPFEERARFMHALNEELANSITRINGVVSARVHIMVPETSPFDKSKTPPRASIFIYQQKGINLKAQIPTIKNLIVNSLDNLEYANVEVALFDETESHVGSPAVSSSGSAIWNLGLLGILAAVVIFGFRYSGGNSSGPRRRQISNDAGV